MANKRFPSKALWLLERLNDSRYDGYDAFVVRAPNAQAARLLADRYGTSAPRHVWTEPSVASCQMLDPAGRPAVVLAAGDSWANTSD